MGRDLTLPTAGDVRIAYERIRADVLETPTVAGRWLGRDIGCSLALKLESMQVTGSYKERGALNRLLELTAEEQRRGVVSASAGNHAQGLAFHGHRLGIRTVVVMPESTPLVKVTATRQFGAEVVLHGGSYDEAQAHALSLAHDGLTLVHPFDDRFVIAGQGTVAVEIIGSLIDFDTLLVPVGGGGLVAGVSTWLREVAPHVDIIGVEPAACPKMTVSLREDRRVEVERAVSAADGTVVRKVGELTFEIARAGPTEMLTVSEGFIADAVLILLERFHLVVEGAGALGLAAILEHPERFRDRKVVSIVSGGNIDVNLLHRLIARGLSRAGRVLVVQVRYRDVSGAMSAALKVLKDRNANILHIDHHRFGADAPFGFVDATLTLETTGQAHAREIEQTLADEGFLVRAPASEREP